MCCSSSYSSGISACGGGVSYGRCSNSSSRRISAVVEKRSKSRDVSCSPGTATVHYSRAAGFDFFFRPLLARFFPTPSRRMFLPPNTARFLAFRVFFFHTRIMRGFPLSFIFAGDYRVVLEIWKPFVLPKGFFTITILTNVRSRG